MAINGTQNTDQFSYRDIEKMVAGGNLPPSIATNPNYYKLIERLYGARPDLREILKKDAPQAATEAQVEIDRQRRLQQQADWEDRAAARAEARADARAAHVSTATSTFSSVAKTFTSSMNSFWEPAQNWMAGIFRSVTDNPLVRNVTSFVTQTVPNFFTKTIPTFVTQTIPRIWNKYAAPVINAAKPYVEPVVNFVTSPFRAAYSMVFGKPAPQAVRTPALAQHAAAAIQPLHPAQASFQPQPGRRRDASLRTMQSQQPAHQPAPTAPQAVAHAAPPGRRRDAALRTMQSQQPAHAPQQVATAAPHRTPQRRPTMAPV